MLKVPENHNRATTKPLSIDSIDLIQQRLPLSVYSVDSTQDVAVCIAALIDLLCRLDLDLLPSAN